MTDYGIQPTGYVRKPLAIILAELEAAMITEFGPGVIQTSQSPFGQLNGLMADLVADVDERNLDLYQSNDPDQAEGIRLDTLARLRLLKRNDRTDEELRKAITNEGQARVDVQDLSLALSNLEGVTFSRVFVNETGEITEDGLEKGVVSTIVIGGQDSEIAETMRRYIVPGVNTFGNHPVTSVINGFCRQFNIVRPTQIDVTLSVQVRSGDDRFGCPPASLQAVKTLILQQWEKERVNGKNISFFNIRSIVESSFTNIEVMSVTGERDDITYLVNQDVPISFVEIAQLTEPNLTVSTYGSS